MIFYLHFACTWLLVGLIWTIQVVHYPQFLEISAENFKASHALHTTRISWLVLPCMIFELVSGLYLLGKNPDLWLVLGMVCLAGVWAVTFFLSVPLHNQLQSGYDTAVIRSLILTNWWRTVFWSLKGLLLLCYIA